MSSDALDIYREHLDEQLGENSPITQKAYFDPDGLNEEIFGVFDDNTFRDGQGRGNFNPKRSGARFTVSSILTFDIYDNANLQITYPVDKIFKIQYIEKDDTGAQVLWLT